MFKTLFFWGLDGTAAAILLLPVFCLLNKHCFHNKRKTVWYFFWPCISAPSMWWWDFRISGMSGWILTST